jgi:hypothetical protein
MRTWKFVSFLLVTAICPAGAATFTTEISDPTLIGELDKTAASPLSLAGLLRAVHQKHGLPVPKLPQSGHPRNLALNGYEQTYGRFTAQIQADIERIVAELGIDWEKDITRTYKPEHAKTPEGREHRKNGNVTRIFNEKWLTSGTGQFLLSGIVNRMDRRDFTPGTCGELRFIYRLGYEVRMGEQTYASRMPFTINMVFTYGGDSEGCASVARLWKTEHTTSTQKLLEGPLDLSRLDFKQMEVNVQAARFPSDLENDTKRHFAGQAIYLMRIFGLKGGVFVPLKLENTPDVLAIRASAEKQKELKAFLAANLKAIDEGAYIMPDSLLADVAITYSTAGSSRVANKPFDLLLNPEEAQQILSAAAVPGPLKFVGGGRGLLERLNTSTCMGCHQASSTAGFHFLGRDRFDYGASKAETKAALDGNRLALPFSPHLFADLPRRAKYIEMLAGGKVPNRFRPHPSAPAAEWSEHAPVFRDAGDNMPCLLDSEKALASGARWACDRSRGLSCVQLVSNQAQSLGLGQCAPSATRLYSGISCRKNVIQDNVEAQVRSGKSTYSYNLHSFLDRVVKDEQLYGLTEGRLDSSSFNCRPTRIGVPLGRVTKACTPAQIALKGLRLDPMPDELCAVVGGRGFEEMAKGYFSSKKFAEGVGRGMLNSCSSSRFCREDYICQEMPDFLAGSRFGVASSAIEEFRRKNIGFCTPTYFVYQLRLDGHPNP